METSTPKKEYYRTVGRRKTSTACVKLVPATKEVITINGKTLKDYFPVNELQVIVTDPIRKSEVPATFTVTATVQGGGFHSQAEAVRHGISRALVEFDEALRTTVKGFGFLKRDPRSKERRKFGLKKARKAPQWSKR